MFIPQNSVIFELSEWIKIAKIFYMFPIKVNNEQNLQLTLQVFYRYLLHILLIYFTQVTPGSIVVVFKISILDEEGKTLARDRVVDSLMERQRAPANESKLHVSVGGNMIELVPKDTMNIEVLQPVRISTSCFLAKNITDYTVFFSENFKLESYAFCLILWTIFLIKNSYTISITVKYLRKHLRKIG